MDQEKERSYLIELGDNEYRVVTESELKRIRDSAMSTDGIMGCRVVGRCSSLIKKDYNKHKKE